MQAMIALVARTSLPAPVFAMMGVGMVIYSGWVYYSVLRRWERFRRRHPSFSRWGRGSIGFPASRIGVLYGTLIVMFMGIMMISSGLSWDISAEWRRNLAAGFLCWLGLCPFIALRDYLLHRSSRDE
jgi:hypothetical protein